MVPSADRAAIVDRLRQTLRSGANASGGWGYYPSKSSRIEPTCWALLALGVSAPDTTALHADREPHLRHLLSLQRADGLLVDHEPATPNFAYQGLAACVIADLNDASLTTPLTRLVDAIVAAKGVALDNADGGRQDNRLQGWSWVPDTFSWAEPTAYCLIALKRTRALHRSGADARIDEANRMLLNRAVQSGGWNYGNASAVGQDLRPYVPTTALALIALQDRRDDPIVSRSLDYLEQAKLSEPSAMALGLAAVALRLYGRSTDDVEARLMEDLDRAERIGNIVALAIALFALSAERHRGRALALSS